MTDATREALTTAKSCIADLGAGKGGWAWEEVLDQIEAALAPQPAVEPSQAQISQLDDASNACLELAAKHGFATGHGDTVADMIREFSAQISKPPALDPATVEALRRKAQVYADFWYGQSTKKPDEHDRFEVLGSQFRKLAEMASALLASPGPAPSPATVETLVNRIDQCAAIQLVGSDGIKGYLPVGSPKIIIAGLRALLASPAPSGESATVEALAEKLFSRLCHECYIVHPAKCDCMEDIKDVLREAALLASPHGNGTVEALAALAQSFAEIITDGRAQEVGSKSIASMIINELLLRRAILASPPSNRKSLCPACNLLAPCSEPLCPNASPPSVTSTSRAESSASLGYKAGLIKAAEIVGCMRQSEAGIFDDAHSGAKGESRSNALYDAYVAIRAEFAQTHQSGGE